MGLPLGCELATSIKKLLTARGMTHYFINQHIARSGIECQGLHHIGGGEGADIGDTADVLHQLGVLCIGK